MQAERLRRHFAILPYLPQHYAPRFVADELLRYVEQHGQGLSRWDLSRMVQEYRSLFRIFGTTSGQKRGLEAVHTGWSRARLWDWPPRESASHE